MKAGQRLTEFCQKHILVIGNTIFQQHKRRLYKWTSPDGQYQNQIDYILCKQILKSTIQSAKTRSGADCGSNHELIMAKFRLKWKKLGKTTRLFRYDLNQTLYDYTVEMISRLKELNLVDGVPVKQWTEIHNIVQEAVTKTIPKKCKKTKWLPEEALQIPEERREVKGKGERERCTQLNAEFQRIARRDKKVFSNEQYKKKKRKTIEMEMGKTRCLFKKIEDIKGTFHAKMSTIKDRYGKT